MKPEITRLNLINPLYYVPEPELDPFVNPFLQAGEEAKNRESLFCFKIADSIANEFEPDRVFYPGDLVFAGSAESEKDIVCNIKSAGSGMSFFELPRGNYIFMQIRDVPGKNGIIDFVIETQKEGLWQRLMLGSRYYVRYVFEECPVTQIFRPYGE